MTQPPSFSPEYFRAMYEADPDPWKFESSEYERRKYQATIEALPNRMPARVFEAGCSIGVLTQMLAPIAGHLLAVDVDERTLDRARARCAEFDNVEFRRSVLPGDWPEGQFDLMLFSEVLYFLSRDDVECTARLALESLSADGAMVLVNWTGPTNYPCGGDEAAELFITAVAPDLRVHRTRREQEYRLDVLTRAG
jgi:SAM-dependent methyltransferase